MKTIFNGTFLSITRSVFSICLVGFLLLGSCSSSDDGKDGETGPAGTANVIYSAWVTVPTWTKTTLYGLQNFSYNIAAPKITADILNTGVVLVYAKLNGYNTTLGLQDNPVQLTYNLAYQEGNVTTTDTWSFLTSTGNVKINFINDKNTYGSISTQHQFRYIIIPGGVSTSKKASVDYQKMSYREVCHYLNIQE